MYQAYLPESQIAKTIPLPNGKGFMLHRFDAVCREEPNQPFIEVSVVNVEIIKHGEKIGVISIPATSEEAVLEYLKVLAEVESYYGIKYIAVTKKDEEAIQAFLA